jgi:hypothetical protein
VLADTADYQNRLPDSAQLRVLETGLRDATATGLVSYAHPAGWSTISMVRTLMICSAVRALTTLAFLFDAAQSVATAQSAGFG